MKRVIFAAVLLAAVIGFNSFCLFTVAKINDDAAERLDFLEYTLRTESHEKTASECEKFSNYWLSAHHILGRIVRHELLEQASSAVALFVPLAEYEEYGELAAEINRCKLLLEEILDSELPLLRNIF